MPDPIDLLTERNRLLGRVMELSNAHNALEDALKVVTDDWRAAEAALSQAIAGRDAVTDKLYDALARVAALEEERDAAQRDLVVAIQKCERQRKALHALNRALEDERSDVDNGPQWERDTTLGLAAPENGGTE